MTVTVGNVLSTDAKGFLELDYNSLSDGCLMRIALFCFYWLCFLNVAVSGLLNLMVFSKIYFYC